MDELRRLIQQYSPYYEMFDDHAGWQRGTATDRHVRALVKRLRAEGHGDEIDALLEEHPNLVPCPNGANVLV